MNISLKSEELFGEEEVGVSVTSTDMEANRWVRLSLLEGVGGDSGVRTDTTKSSHSSKASVLVLRSRSKTLFCFDFWSGFGEFFVLFLYSDFVLRNIL